MKEGDLGKEKGAFLSHFLTFLLLFIVGTVLSREVFEPLAQPLGARFFTRQIEQKDRNRTPSVAVADISRSRLLQTSDDQGEVLALESRRIKKLFDAIRTLPPGERPSAVAFDFDVSNNYIVLEADDDPNAPPLILDSEIDKVRHREFVELCSEFTGSTGIPVRFGVGLLGFIQAKEFFIGDGADSYAAAVFLTDDLERQPLYYRRDIDNGAKILKTLGVSIAQADCVRRESGRCDMPLSTEEEVKFTEIQNLSDAGHIVSSTPSFDVNYSLLSMIDTITTPCNLEEGEEVFPEGTSKFAGKILFVGDASLPAELGERDYRDIVVYSDEGASSEFKLVRGIYLHAAAADTYSSNPIFRLGALEYILDFIFGFIGFLLTVWYSSIGKNVDLKNRSIFGWFERMCLDSGHTLSVIVPLSASFVLAVAGTMLGVNPVIVFLLSTIYSTPFLVAVYRTIRWRNQTLHMSWYEVRNFLARTSLIVLIFGIAVIGVYWYRSMWISFGSVLVYTLFEGWVDPLVQPLVRQVGSAFEKVGAK